MSTFERELPSFRLAETQFGDTLPDFAAREMGDANRWPELVWINKLVHPYITNDPARVAPGVILAGAFLKVPAPGGLSGSDASERGQVYERDCRLRAGLLETTDGGDLAIMAGADNLRQQLEHRIATPRGQLTRHPSYGCMVYRLVGKANGPTTAKLGAEYVKSALAADYRVRSVESATAQVVGDAVKIQARAVAIEGGVVDIVQGGQS